MVNVTSTAGLLIGFKAIAAELGISAKTVEDHRASIMRKMQVRSVAELVRLVADGRRRPAQ